MKRSQTSRRRATRSSFSAPFSMTKNTSTSLSARIACCVTYSGSPAPIPMSSMRLIAAGLTRCGRCSCSAGPARRARSRPRWTTRRACGSISTLAGRIANPRLPVGEVRVGGFGGPDGLAAYIARGARRRGRRRDAPVRRADVVVGVRGLRADRHAAAAARAPAVRARPGDRLARGRARSARPPRCCPPAGRRVFLTTGRQGLAAFARVADAFFLIRCVDAPDPQRCRPTTRVLLDRGPFTLAGELELDRPPRARRPRHEGLRRRDDAGQARRRARARAAGDRRRAAAAARGADRADRRGGARLARRAGSRPGS